MSHKVINGIFRLFAPCDNSWPGSVVRCFAHLGPPFASFTCSLGIESPVAISLTFSMEYETLKDQWSDVEDRDGIRLSWNTFPSSRMVGSSVVPTHSAS